LMMKVIAGMVDGGGWRVVEVEEVAVLVRWLISGASQMWNCLERPETEPRTCREEGTVSGLSTGTGTPTCQCLPLSIFYPQSSTVDRYASLYLSLARRH
jgi:hypothetical protein